MTIRNETARNFPPVDVRALLASPFRRCSQDVRADVVAEGAAFDPHRDPVTSRILAKAREPGEHPLLVGPPDAWTAFETGEGTQVVVRPAYRPGFASNAQDAWAASLCDWLAALGLLPLALAAAGLLALLVVGVVAASRVHA